MAPKCTFWAVVNPITQIINRHVIQMFMSLMQIKIPLKKLRTLFIRGKDLVWQMMEVRFWYLEDKMASNISMICKCFSQLKFVQINAEATENARIKFANAIKDTQVILKNFKFYNVKLGTSCESKMKCPKNCNYRGICDSNAICKCYIGYFGNECEKIIHCPFNCTGNGLCQRNKKCLCNPGYTGIVILALIIGM
jgi:hypothetical protein